MKKSIFVLFILLAFVGFGVATAFLLTKNNTTEKQTNLSKTSDENEKDEKDFVSFEKTVKVTPDNIYSFGAFCRVNYLPKTDEFFVTFGGANYEVQQEYSDPAARPGGAEGGNGYSYKIYTKNFEETEKNGIIHNGGGDAASVVVGDYYYFLSGGGANSWIIKKIDTASWQTADSVMIKMDTEHEMLNDQMLAFANGQIIASGLYDAGGKAEGNQKNTDPNKGYATHNHLFDTDLNQLDYFILDDTPHINGSYVVFVDGIYNYITSTAFFGDLIVMRYDENWNFLDSKTIDEGGQWSQGAVYDEKTERFYVAFIDLPPINKTQRPPEFVTQAPDIALAIFDKNWNQLEKINVTGYSTEDMKSGGRPSVILYDNKLYVSYDVSSLPGRGEKEKADWQCEVKIYNLK